MSEGMVDLAILILILAVVIGVSFSLIMPIVNDSAKEQTLYNKTVDKVQGEKVAGYGTYDGKLSKLEAILATQVMDWGSPEPRKIKVDSTEVNVTSTYRNDLVFYAQSVWERIKADANTVRYNYIYSFENASNANDDCYRLVRN